MDNLLNLLPTILLALFSMACLLLVNKPKGSTRKTIIYTTLFMLVLLTFNVIGFYDLGRIEFESYNMITIFIPQAIFAYYMGKRTFKSSITASLNAFLAVYALQLVKNLLFRYFDLEITEYTQILLYPFVLFFLKHSYLKLHNEIELFIPKLLFAILLFTGITYTELFVYNYLVNNTTAHVLRYDIFGVAIMSIYFVSILIFNIIIKQYKTYVIDLKDRQILERELSLLEDALKMREIKDDQLRILRHDLRHVLITINSLINENKLEEASKLINEYSTQINKTTTEIYCNDNIINSIIEYYDALCKENNIEFRVKMNNFEEILSISSHEMAIFISNCLENAINATKKLDNNRYISFTFLNNQSRLVLQIENSFDGNIEFDSENIPTNKNLGHGIGTSSMKWFASRNGLLINYDISEKTFKISVLFK